MIKAKDEIIAGPQQRTEEWFATKRWDSERPKRDGLPEVTFGATDAAKLCALSNYGSPLDKYNELCGLQASWTPTPGDLRAELGIRLEPTVLALAARLLPEQFPELLEHVDSLGNLPIRTGIPLLWRSSNPHIGASLDALLPGDIPCDAKTTWSIQAASNFGEPGTDDIPTDYLLQGQAQLAVTGAEYCYFPVLFGVGVMKCYRVPRSEDLINVIIAAGTEMLERVRNQDPPEPTWSSSSAIDAVRHLNPMTSGEIVEASEELVENWTEVERLRLEISDLKKEQDARIAKSMFLIGDSAAALTGSHEIVRHDVTESVYTQEDVEKLQKKVDDKVVKRKSYWYLKSKKRKGIDYVKPTDDVVGARTSG